MTKIGNLPQQSRRFSWAAALILAIAVLHPASLVAAGMNNDSSSASLIRADVQVSQTAGDATGTVNISAFECDELGNTMLEYKSSGVPAADATGCEPGAATFTFSPVRGVDGDDGADASDATDSSDAVDATDSSDGVDATDETDDTIIDDMVDDGLDVVDGVVDSGVDDQLDVVDGVVDETVDDIDLIDGDGADATDSSDGVDDTIVDDMVDDSLDVVDGVVDTGIDDQLDVVDGVIDEAVDDIDLIDGGPDSSDGSDDTIIDDMIDDSLDVVDGVADTGIDDEIDVLDELLDETVDDIDLIDGDEGGDGGLLPDLLGGNDGAETAAVPSYTLFVGASISPAHVTMPYMQTMQPLSATVNSSGSIELPVGTYVAGIQGTSASLNIQVVEGNNNPVLVGSLLAQSGEADGDDAASPVTGLPSTGSGTATDFIWPAAAAASVLMLLGGHFVVGSIRKRNV